MKIDSHNPLLRPGQNAPRSEAEKTREAGRAVGQASGPAAQTHLSHHAADTRQDIDSARVAEIREAIREGRLAIQAERIADGLIASVQELLGKGRS